MRCSHVPMHSSRLVRTGMHTGHGEAGLAESQTAACHQLGALGRVQEGADLTSPGVGAPHTDTA